jgi:imidazolonepropionase-like amidohydrolase
MAKPGAALLAACVAVVALTAQQPALVLVNATVLIGDGRAIEDGALVIEDGRITRVGRMEDLRRPSRAQRVDLQGKFVMPALIDAHTHIGYENMSSWRAENYTRENLLDSLDRLSYYGVGTFFSVGTDLRDMAVAIQRDLASGTITGPRFVFAAGFGPPNAGPNAALLKELAKFNQVVVRGITGDADARQGVRDVARQGYPFIKLWVTDRGGTMPKMKPAAYRPAIDEAHKHNIKVVAHVTDSLDDAKDLARAGLDGSVHAVLDADAEFAALMKKNNGFLLPSQGLGMRGNIPGMQPWFEDPFFQETAPAATLERYRRQLAAAQPAGPNAPTFQQRLQRVGQMIKVLQDGGVKIGIGTDSGATPDYPFGFPTHRELELYVKAGMTTEQVLTAATKTGAEILRVEKDLGTLEAGKVANVLVLDADPRADITNTRRISRVYLQGKEIDRAALRRKWNSSATQ